MRRPYAKRVGPPRPKRRRRPIMPACGSLVGYFPSKRAFFAAIVEEEGAKLLRASTPDLSLPPFDQIKAGLEVYIDHAEHFPDGYRMAHQAAITDSDLCPTRQTRINVQRDRNPRQPGHRDACGQRDSDSGHELARFRASRHSRLARHPRHLPRRTARPVHPRAVGRGRTATRSPRDVAPLRNRPSGNKPPQARRQTRLGCVDGPATATRTNTAESNTQSYQ